MLAGAAVESAAAALAGAAQLAQLLDGRLMLAVIAELACGGRRYQDLDDTLDGISHKVLPDTLRRAERDSLVVRHLDPGALRQLPPISSRTVGRTCQHAVMTGASS